MMGPATFLGSRFLYLGREKALKVRRGCIESETPIGDVHKTRLVILGKPHYYETIHSFPFANIKEIREAVIMDIPAYSPFETPLFLMKKLDIPDGGCRVNLWFIRPDAVELLKRLSPMIIIPESGLLALEKDSAQNLYHIQKQGINELWVHVGNDLLTQSMDVCDKNMEQETFTRIIGGNAEKYAVTVIADQQEYMEILHGALMNMSFNAAWPFLFPIKSLSNFNPKNLKIGLTVAAALFMIYLSVIVAIPYSAESRLIKVDQELTPRIAGLMKIQRQVEALYARQNELTGILRKHIPKLPLLILLNDILPENTIIFQLVCAGNTVEFKGITPKSTALLDAVSSQPVIQNARYTSPIRQDQASSREVFTLSFVYNPADTAAP
jgi:hypothetical protein